MATEIQEKAIARHLRDYGQLIHAEAEKMEILGIETTPSLFDKAREIYYLAEQIGTRIKVLYDADLDRHRSATDSAIENLN